MASNFGIRERETFGETNNKNCKASYVQENALAYIKENSLTLKGDFQSNLEKFTIREAWRLKIQSKSNQINQSINQIKLIL